MDTEWTFKDTILVSLRVTYDDEIFDSLNLTWPWMYLRVNLMTVYKAMYLKEISVAFALWKCIFLFLISSNCKFKLAPKENLQKWKQYGFLPLGLGSLLKCPVYFCFSLIISEQNRKKHIENHQKITLIITLKAQFD